MQIIHGALQNPPPCDSTIILKVDRLRLAKRRWRGFAEDGTEFGFDLDQPLMDGAFFFCTASCLYQLAQLPEPVIDIPCPANPSTAAHLGWLLGNLHFPLQLLEGTLRICDDPAVRQMLVRDGIAHTLKDAIFQPIKGGHSHGA